MKKKLQEELIKEIDCWLSCKNYRQRPVYILLRDELGKLGHWKAKSRGSYEHLYKYHKGE